MQPPQPNPDLPDTRRRFLRDTLKGSVPFFLGWIAGQARGLARALESAPTPRETSPPPAVEADLPPATRQAIEQRHAEFARDNPDHDPYLP